MGVQDKDGDMIRSGNGSDDALSRILGAAALLFKQKGFHATSMDAIAAGARMSKRTIYEHFSNKHAILEVVLTEFTTAAFRRIAAQTIQPSSPRAELLALAAELQRAATTNESVQMVRLQIAEAEYLPEVAERLARHGLQQTSELLGPLFQRLGLRDQQAAAQLAYDLLVIVPLHRRLTGSNQPKNDTVKVIDLILGSHKKLSD